MSITIVGNAGAKIKKKSFYSKYLSKILVFPQSFVAFSLENSLIAEIIHYSLYIIH